MHEKSLFYNFLYHKKFASCQNSATIPASEQNAVYTTQRDSHQIDTQHLCMGYDNSDYQW